MRVALPALVTMTPPMRARVSGHRAPNFTRQLFGGSSRLELSHPLMKSLEYLVPKIVVEVMPKAELLDPQGKAVAASLTRLGKSQFTGVRIGKRFELTVDGAVDDAVLAEVRQLAEDMFSNSVIEDVVEITVDGATVGVSL